MRTSLLLLFGLATVATASPAFAQSDSAAHFGTGNYNLSGSYGGKQSGVSVLGDTTMPGMNVGGSSLGNGNIGTSYGSGSPSAGLGSLTIGGNGLSDSMSGLPAASGPTVPAYEGRLHPMK
jgi:hypothetical protein